MGLTPNAGTHTSRGNVPPRQESFVCSVGVRGEVHASMRSACVMHLSAHAWSASCMLTQGLGDSVTLPVPGSWANTHSLIGSFSELDL